MLEIQDALLVLFNSLQIVAAMLVWGARTLPLWPRRFMSLFFAISALNLGVLWMADTPGGVVNSSDVYYLNWLRGHADALSVWPLAALLIATVWPGRWGIRSALAAMAIGTVYFLQAAIMDIPRALAPEPWDPGFVTPFPWSLPYEWQAAAFYPVAALMILVLARRRDALAWLGLAMVPRMMFWMTNLAMTVAIDPNYPVLGDAFLRWVLVASPIAILGIVDMIRRRALPMAVVAAAVLVGPMIYFAELSELGTVLRQGNDSLNLIINLTTMALFRPLIAVNGIHVRAIPHTVSWALAGTAATVLVALVLLPILDVVPAKLMATATGLFAVAMLEARFPLAANLAASARLQRGTTVGPWRVQRLLGRSGRSEVYLATQGRSKAVLKLAIGPAVDEATWRREADALARIEHPNVLRILGMEESAEGLCLVLEHVPGETLEQRLLRGPLEPEMLADLGDALLAGVAAIHEAGLVHRDIKPSNIMVGDDIKIMDFDVARLHDADATLVGAVPLGTPAYMSPQQARGEGTDPRSDHFAVAAVLHEARTGRPLIAGDRPGKSLFEVATMTRPPTTEPPWNTWFDVALHPEVGERHADAETMRQAWIEVSRPQAI